MDNESAVFLVISTDNMFVLIILEHERLLTQIA